MAVESPASRVYRAFKQRMFLLLFALQMAIVCVSLLVLWQFGIALESSTIVLTASIIFVSTFSFLVLAHYVAQPVRDIEEFANSVMSSVANGGLPNPPKPLKRNLVAPEMSQVMQAIYEVTERSQREKFNLSSEDTSLQSLLRDLPTGCIILNEKAELTAINPLANALLGLQNTGVTTQQVMNRIRVLRSNGEPVHIVDWLHQVRTNEIKSYQQWGNVVLEYQNENGEQQQTSFDLMASFHKQDAKKYNLVLLLVDRSKEFNQQQKQMEFISLAAHELRGPLTVMSGLVDIFREEVQPTLDQEHAELVGKLSVSTKQLAGYVNNILGVSKLDRDGFEVHAQSADWLEVLSKCKNELIERAEANHRTLVFELPKKLPTISVDPSAIAHVINNLVDNAIKYSKDDGKIIVSTKQKDSVIETTVQDFGIGISANIVDNLFVKFYRSHRSKRTVSGTGLGLYLCKAIVEAHGGTIWVRSTEGVGSTFGFSLPTYESAKQNSNTKKTEDGIIRGSHGWIKNHALYRR